MATAADSAAGADATGADVKVSYNGIYHQQTNHSGVVYLVVCLLNVLIACTSTEPSRPFVDACAWKRLYCVFSLAISGAYYFDSDSLDN